MIGLTKEQTLLLQYMQYALQGKTIEKMPDGETDWSAILREARDHAVPALFFQVIAPLEKQLPSEIYMKSFELARRVAANNLRIEFAQNELVQVLEQAQIPYVILKGETAAVEYPDPESRLLGDVDFLVPMEKTEEVKEKMTALGYRHRWEPGDYHQVLEKPNISLEMHMEVAGMPEGRHHAAMEEFFADIYEKSRVLDRGMGAFSAPGKAHQGMTLLLHMQHHVLARGMGLRHIMDWGCFVSATAEDAFWQEELIPMLKKVGLFRFASVTTKMASVYLGTACPDWVQGVSEELCHDFMKDIMNGGNFGRKDADRARAINMLPDWEQQEKETGKLKLLYRTLRGSVLKRHPELAKRPVTLFFYMVGKTIRYMVLFCMGKRPNLLKAASHANTRRTVYEQLHMFETE